MKKILSIMTLLITLTCCSGNYLTSYLNPVSQQPVTGDEESATRNNMV